jgi:hypothetical protein
VCDSLRGSPCSPFGRLSVMRPTIPPLPTLSTLMCVCFGAPVSDDAERTATTARPHAAVCGTTRATRPTASRSPTRAMVFKLGFCEIKTKPFVRLTTSDGGAKDRVGEPKEVYVHS